MEFILNIRVLVTASLIALALAACSGGGNAPAPLTTQTLSVPSPVPNGSNSVYTSTLTSAAQQATGISSSSIAIPTADGVPAGSLAVSAAPPTGITTFSYAGPVLLPQGQRAKKSTTLDNATALAYIGFTPSANFTLPASSPVTFSFTLVNGPQSGTDYHLAFSSAGVWSPDLTDIGTVNGSTVTITVTPPADVTLSAGSPYGIVLYSIPASVDTGASPAPSASPTSTPIATLSTSGTLLTGAAGASAVSYSGTLFGEAAEIAIPPDTVGNQSLAYTVSLTPPTGVTPPTINVTTVYGYATVTPANTITFPAGSTVTGSLAYPTGATPSGTFSVAYSLDGINWVYGFGSATASNGSFVNYSYTSSVDLTLSANTTYYLAIYQ